MAKTPGKTHWQNIRELDTLAQIQHTIAAIVKKRLTHRDLVADTDRSAVAS